MRSDFKKIASAVLTVVLAMSIVFGCGEPDSRRSSGRIVMTPDYRDIVIPFNIAPLNFLLEGVEGKVVVSVTGGQKNYVFRAKAPRIVFPLNKWHSMLDGGKGNRLSVTVSQNDSTILEFYWDVSPDPIDKYLSYRLIEPAYEVWNLHTVEERDLEGYKVRTLGDNNTAGHSCMNCHTSNRADSPATFFHVRGKTGGTFYAKDGVLRKLDTKTDSTAGAAVYGEIERSGRFGIFTTAQIMPILHSGRLDRLEVFDTSSDLFVVDFQNNTVTDNHSVRGEEFQETFPCFSPDGKTIYFCRAKSLPQPDSTKRMRYDLYSVAFDPETGVLSDSLTLVFEASALGKSVSFPKCSPDGSRILFCVSDYGTFPIWHTETDLWMLDCRTSAVDTLADVNGRYSDSYHCWSTNGKWIVWASKRDDRVYGRPYFAYLDSDGNVSRPFVLPQRDPSYYLSQTQSFNIPELYSAPETYSHRDITRMYFISNPEKMIYKVQD